MMRKDTRRWEDGHELKGRTLSVAAIVGAAGVAASLYSTNQQKHSAQDAANAQASSGDAAIDEQRRQFDTVQKLLQPYNTAGTQGLTGQQDLLGLNGAGAQQESINALKSSPQFTSLLQAGNENILANASATGGLRGGNTQAALAQFSPQLLNQVIDQQYGRLGAMTTLGQNSAVMTGNAGQNSANQISNLLQQNGAAQAGGALASGRANAGFANSLAGGLGAFAAYGGSFGGGGGSGYTSGGNPGGYQDPDGLVF